MRKNIKNVLIVVILFLFLYLLILNKETSILEFKNNTELFFDKLFPSAFLFLVISQLLLDYLPLLLKNNSIYFYIFILSIVSGYPSGSIMINNLLEKNEINENIAKKMILYSHFPNPLFVLYNLTIILDSNTSIKCFISILLSNLLIYLFIKKEKIIKKEIINQNNFTISLKKAIQKTFESLFIIYGTTILFEQVSFFLCRNINSINIYVLINGLFDLTKGVAMSSLISNIYLRSYYLIFFISFTSLSIHFQTNSILGKKYYKYYLKGRIISALLSFLIFSIILLL